MQNYVAESYNPVLYKRWRVGKLESASKSKSFKVKSNISKFSFNLVAFVLFGITQIPLCVTQRNKICKKKNWKVVKTIQCKKYLPERVSSYILQQFWQQSGLELKLLEEHPWKNLCWKILFVFRQRLPFICRSISRWATTNWSVRCHGNAQSIAQFVQFMLR